MGQRIGVSKAARMLGIKRSELNKRLAAAKIETFEGEVDFEKVKCIAPLLEQTDPHLERMQRIRDNASYGDLDKSAGDGIDLQSRVEHLSRELAIETETAAEYRKILEAVATKLGELQASESEEQRELGFELCEWLRGKVNTG